jgi:hypothetical protein
MNQDHAIAGVGGVSTTAMLATVLQAFQHIDTATATSEAGLIVLALGALTGIVQVMLGARKPAPPSAAVIPSVWMPPAVTVPGSAPPAPVSSEPHP